MAQHECVGYLVDGIPVYPDLTLDGREYGELPAAVKFIGGGRFVVLDGIPADFDVQAAIDEIDAAPDAPTKSRSNRVGQGKVDTHAAS